MLKPYPELLCLGSTELTCVPLTSLTMVCLLNRKGHYTRALEEAIQTHNSQWPQAWNGKNPLHGGGSFNKMAAEARVRLEEAAWNVLVADCLRTAYAA